MKLAYTVHSVHDTKVAVAAKTADGRDVEALVPGLVVELVPVGAGRSMTIDVEAEPGETHDQLLRRYGFGAPVTVEFTTQGEGKIPHEVRMSALPAHIDEVERDLLAAQKALDEIPAGAGNDDVRVLAAQRVTAGAEDLTRLKKRLADHLKAVPEIAAAPV